jgi:hypothetical protein
MHEIRNFNPRRAAQLLAIIYGAMFGLITVLAVPMMMLAPADPAHGQLPKALLLVMLVLYPLFGAGMGWVTGQVASRLYNWASRKYGGLLIEVTPIGETTR